MIKPSMTPERQWEIITSFLTDAGVCIVNLGVSEGKSPLEYIEFLMNMHPVAYRGILKPVEPPVPHIKPEISLGRWLELGQPTPFDWEKRLKQHNPEPELKCLDCINHKRCKNPLHEAGAPVCNDFVPYGVKKG